MIKVSESILKFLELNEIKCVFGIPSGTVSPLYDSMNDVAITPIFTKNEAGAAYMAARYAASSQKLAVCFVAGGVGINNMMNGIGDAMRAKAPMLVISGYINRWQMGKGAIQELDTQDVTRPITKYSKTILREEDIMKELEAAMIAALTPPCGPVHLSIPVDVQLSEIEEIMLPKINIAELQKVELDHNQAKQAADVINAAEQGLIMVGKGCKGLSERIMHLSERLQWPIITTPEGKGVIPSEFALNLGNYGFSNTDESAEYVDASLYSTLLIIGTSLGEASTCNFNDVLVKGKKVIHVDRDLKERNKVFDANVFVHGDLWDVIPYFIEHTRASDRSFQRSYKTTPYVLNHTGISFRLFLEKLPQVMPKNTHYVCDTGEFMNFVFKYLNLPAEGDFEVNANYAAMGAGVAGAIGVYVADKNKPVAVLAGDGCFFMNGLEILTAKEYSMPIIYIIINNAMYAYVEHGHQFLYNRVLEGFKQERVSIAEMMQAAGVKAMQINTLEDMDLMQEFMRDLKGPCVIEVNTDGSEPAPILDRMKALKKRD